MTNTIVMKTASVGECGTRRSLRPRLIPAPGATLLVAPHATPAESEAALEALRTFRAAGRRVIWCDASELADSPHVDLHAWGARFVEDGLADALIVSGHGSRELAMAARDAGLPVGRVVVCSDDPTARNLLNDSLVPGDTVLALGISNASCDKLTERLASRFEVESVAA
ncbi:MAG: hypothetical protein KDA44_11855 [Planctomycetales bacterium]|nr:hypothetical protein [Planctomycetales bacterium]